MLRKTAFTCTKVFTARKLSTATAAKVGAKGLDIIHPTIGLTEERTEFYNLARSFADNELRPYASKWDRESEFPVETFKKFGELGFGGIFVKEDVGGTALSRADAISIVEGLATGCVGTTAMLTIHNMCASTIDKFGNDEQRNRWLPKIVAMETLISFCLTEPGEHSLTYLSQTRISFADNIFTITQAAVLMRPPCRPRPCTTPPPTSTWSTAPRSSSVELVRALPLAI